MAENGTLNRRQRLFVSALLSSPTIQAAAEAAGIAPRTAHRYLKDSAVKQALAEALDAAMGQATRRAVDEMLAALTTLAEIHRDRDAAAGTRVSAAKSILDAGPKLREAQELGERVSQLEDAILGGGNK